MGGGVLSPELQDFTWRRDAQALSCVSKPLTHLFIRMGREEWNGIYIKKTIYGMMIYKVTNAFINLNKNVVYLFLYLLRYLI